MTTLPPIIHVVDDDASFCAALGELLSACGYRVALYESAEQLLKTLPGGDHGCIAASPKCTIKRYGAPHISTIRSGRLSISWR